MKNYFIVLILIFSTKAAFGINPNSYFLGAFKAANIPSKNLQAKLSWSGFALANNALSKAVDMANQATGGGPIWNAGILYIVKFIDESERERICQGIITNSGNLSLPDERIVQVVCVSQTTLFLSVFPLDSDVNIQAVISSQGAALTH